jgi:hypothetical protein
MILSCLFFVASILLLVTGYFILTDTDFDYEDDAVSFYGSKVIQELHSIKQLLGSILSLVQIDQDVLDSYGVALGEIASALSAEIEALKVAVPSLPAANVAAIDAQVAALSALEAPAPSA